RDHHVPELQREVPAERRGGALGRAERRAAAAAEDRPLGAGLVAGQAAGAADVARTFRGCYYSSFMKAVGVSIAKREVRLIDHPEPKLVRPDDVKIRIREVGVCGTDREICEFKFGEPPAGSQHLVLGHEAVGEVVEAGNAVKDLRPGMLVVPMVRLPCEIPACAACRADRQDYCSTDTFEEHGIRRSHGFMTEQVVERE